MHKSSSTSSFKRAVLTSIVFALPLILLLYTLDFVFTRALVASNHEDISYLEQVIEGNVNADILISGSSRALVHFDCGEIQMKTNMSCFNMGMNGTGLQMQLPILKAYIEANESPKVIIQEVGVTSFNRPKQDKLIYNKSQYMPFLNNETLYSQLSNFDNEMWKYKHLPFYDFLLYRDNMYDAAQTLLGEELENRRQDNGYRPTNRKWDGSFDEFKKRYPEGINVGIEKEFIDYLEQLVEVAQSTGADVILVYTPEYFENQELTKNRREVIEQFEMIADKYEIRFFNYSDSSMTQDKGNFYNSQHLKSHAAEKFSSEVGDRLRKTISSPET